MDVGAGRAAPPPSTAAAGLAGATGAGAVILDLGKVVPAPAPAPEEGLERREGVLGVAACVVVDVRPEGGHGGSWSAEDCRICHVSPDRPEKSEGSELILLGCGCKNQMGVAHRQCAEAWFKLRGNRCCEICGATAKNITGMDDANFLVEWSEGTPSSAGNAYTAERGRCWGSQPLCNFLMACLVMAFILPWLFRLNT